jgi:hypothetical protein
MQNATVAFNRAFSFFISLYKMYIPTRTMRPIAMVVDDASFPIIANYTLKLGLLGTFGRGRKREHFSKLTNTY